MPTLIHRRVAEAQREENPKVITRMRSGWIVMGDVQFLRGYCLLLPDPVVPHLNALAFAARRQFLQDMTVVGDALLKLTGALRINYELLGNLEPALHAHIIPRYAGEPEVLRTKPIWSYDWSVGPDFNLERDRVFMQELAAEIARHA